MSHRAYFPRQRQLERAPPDVVLSLPERVWQPDIVWEKDSSCSSASGSGSGGSRSVSRSVSASGDRSRSRSTSISPHPTDRRSGRISRDVSAGDALDPHRKRSASTLRSSANAWHAGAGVGAGPGGQTPAKSSRSRSSTSTSIPTSHQNNTSHPVDSDLNRNDRDKYKSKHNDLTTVQSNYRLNDRNDLVQNDPRLSFSDSGASSIAGPSSYPLDSHIDNASNGSTQMTAQADTSPTTRTTRNGKRTTHTRPRGHAHPHTHAQVHATRYFSKDECAICMDNFQAGDVVRILPCGHVFHKTECDEWLMKWRKLVCPLRFLSIKTKRC